MLAVAATRQNNQSVSRTTFQESTHDNCQTIAARMHARRFQRIANNG
jgi:hypothetical protein